MNLNLFRLGFILALIFSSFEILASNCPLVVNRGGTCSGMDNLLNRYKNNLDTHYIVDEGRPGTCYIDGEFVPGTGLGFIVFKQGNGCKRPTCTGSNCNFNDENKDCPSSGNPIVYSSGKKFINASDDISGLHIKRRFDYIPNGKVEFRKLWNLNIDGLRFPLSNSNLPIMVDVNRAEIELGFSNIAARHKQYLEWMGDEYTGTGPVFLAPSAKFSVDVYVNNKHYAVQMTGANIQEDFDSNTPFKLEMNDQTDIYGGWLITMDNGDVYDINTDGTLKKLISQNGGVVSYVYSLNDFDLYDIVSTNSSNGQITNLTWETDSKLVVSDPSNNKIVYTIDESNPISPSISVEFSDGRSELYIHDHTVDGEGLPLPQYGSLKTIHYNQNPTPYLTYSYDPITGRPIHESKAGGFEEVNIEYIEDVDSNIIQTKVTNALNKVTNYNFEIGTSGNTELVNVDGESIGTCAATNAHYSYDSNGFKRTTTDKRGNVKETIRNGRGLITEERTGLTWEGAVNVSNLVETSVSQKIVAIWMSEINKPLTRTYYNWDAANTVYSPIKDEVTTYTLENRIETFTITDLTTFTVPYSTNGRTKTWTNSYSYHDAGNTKLAIKTIDGPRSDVPDITTYEYDISGNLTRITDAKSQVTLLSNHNLRGQVGTIVDANNVTTTLTYTSAGNLDTVMLNDQLVMHYDYYQNGLLQKITLADGNWLSYEYNDARYLTAIENNLGERVENTELSLLDGEWKSQASKNSTATIVTMRNRIFDELGRLMTILGQNGQQSDLRYDASNNLKTENDALKSIAQPSNTYQYDELNRLKTSVDALGNPIAFEYDGLSNVTKVTDQRGNSTDYIYDGFGQLIQQTSPDTGVTIFEYDEAGNLTKKTNASVVPTVYTYDALSRLETVTYPDATLNVTYTYDDTTNANFGAGKMTGFTDASGTTELVYGAFGLTSLKSCLTTGQCFTTAYNQNAFGRVDSVDFPSGGQVIYSYDALGRINAVDYQEVGQGSAETVLSNVTYYPFGGMAQLTYGNGVVVDVNQDLDGRVDSITAQGNTTLYNKTYAYYLDNNVELITDGVDAEMNRTFGYDDLKRLTSDEGGSTVKSFEDFGYDVVGNRTAHTLTDKNLIMLLDETLTYDVISNKLTNVSDTVASSSQSVAHNANGHIITIGNKTYNYNDANRLGSSKVNGVDVAAYSYNALGQRTLKTPAVNPAANTRYYQFDQAGQLMSEHNVADLNSYTDYIYVNGMLVSQVVAGAPDADNDGVPDSVDAFPNDVSGGTRKSEAFESNKPVKLIIQTDIDRLDFDGDGVPDATDNYPLDAAQA